MKKYILMILFFLNFAFVFQEGKMEVSVGMEMKAASDRESGDNYTESDDDIAKLGDVKTFHIKGNDFTMESLGQDGDGKDLWLYTDITGRQFVFIDSNNDRVPDFMWISTTPSYPDPDPTPAPTPPDPCDLPGADRCACFGDCPCPDGSQPCLYCSACGCHGECIEPPTEKVCPNATIKITDANNSNRTVTGGTLKMVVAPGTTRSARFDVTPSENYTPESGYPRWSVNNVTGDGFTATAQFQSSGNVSVTLNEGCSETIGNVEIVDENEKSLSSEISAWTNKIASITSGLNSLIDNGNTFQLDLNASGEMKLKNVDMYGDGTSTGICVSGSAGMTGAIKVPKISTSPHYIYGIVYVKGELSPFDIKGGLTVGGKYDESQSSSSGINGNLTFGSEISGSIIVAAGIDDVCSVGGIGTASTRFQMTGTLTYENKKLILSSEASMTSIHLEGSVFVKVGSIECKPFTISKDVGSEVGQIFSPITLLDNN